MNTSWLQYRYHFIVFMPYANSRMRHLHTLFSIYVRSLELEIFLIMINKNTLIITLMNFLICPREFSKDFTYINRLFITNLCSRRYYYSHFTDEEIEVQKQLTTLLIAGKGQSQYQNQAVSGSKVQVLHHQATLPLQLPTTTTDLDLKTISMCSVSIHLLSHIPAQ